MDSFKVRLVAAFAAVYIIWGSTYLAIRFAIDTIPPFLMAGVRFLIAGALLYGWLRARGVPAPTRIHWKGAAIVGMLLLFGGNGGVVWAEQRVPSGLAALLIAMVPLWMVLLDWLQKGPRPTVRTLSGLALGFVGMVLLVGPGQVAGGQGVDLIGVLALLAASFSWATGSLYARRISLPDSPLLVTAMEMLAGGTLLVLFGTVVGEWGALDVGAISLRSLLAVAFLIVFGSLVAFSAYVWLLRVASAAHVATYAYVNPIVAVFLGWAFAGETLSARMIVAAAIIIAAVVLITLPKRGSRRVRAQNAALASESAA